jgi:ADP-heptose:LPS heptosyltransferase
MDIAEHRLMQEVLAGAGHKAEPMKALIVNLTRFGDLIQTQPLIRILSDSGYEVGLACLENFASAADLLDGLSTVLPLPGAALLAPIDQQWHRSIGALDRYTAGIGQFSPDLVVNLTPSLPARLLAGMVRAREHRGFCLDQVGFGVYSSPWAAFLQASSRSRGCSPFNLVDLLIRVAHLQPSPGPTALRAPSGSRLECRERLRCLSPGHQGRFVGFQLGASDDRRRWPVEHFAILGRMLEEKTSAIPVLLGSRSEEGLGLRYERAGGPCVNLIGRTDLPGLATALRGLDALVTNDTGTMHLAAGLNVPIVSVFLATAQPWDTGPYLEGSLCLEPDLDCHPCGFGTACSSSLECRRRIEPVQILRQLEHLFATGGWTRPSSPGPRAWVTRREGDGFMGLECLSRHGNDERSSWILLQRSLYRHFLDESKSITAPPGHGGMSARQRESIAGTLRKTRGLLLLLSQQARLLGRSGQTARKFMTTWHLVAGQLEENPSLAVLAHLWVAQTQEQGLDQDALHTTIARYQELISTMLSVLMPGEAR